jgi:hypothetical protein
MLLTVKFVVYSAYGNKNFVLAARQCGSHNGFPAHGNVCRRPFYSKTRVVQNKIRFVFQFSAFHVKGALVVCCVSFM